MRRAGLIDNKTAKRMIVLDDTFGVIRHITGISSKQFIDNITAQIQFAQALDACGTKGDDEQDGDVCPQSKRRRIAHEEGAVSSDETATVDRKDNNINDNSDDGKNDSNDNSDSKEDVNSSRTGAEGFEEAEQLGQEPMIAAVATVNRSMDTDEVLSPSQKENDRQQVLDINVASPTQVIGAGDIVYYRDDPFPSKVIRVGHDQYAGEVRIARIDADFKSWTTGRWVSETAVYLLEVGDTLEASAKLSDATQEMRPIPVDTVVRFQGWDPDGDALIRIPVEHGHVNTVLFFDDLLHLRLR